MNRLNENLTEILRQKNEVLTPDKVKKGVEYFGRVGTLESGAVKLFETVEEMNEDTTSEENDLAVVYSNSVSTWNGEGTITGATFPSTVTLPSTASRTNIILRSDDGMFDCTGTLSSTSLQLRIYTESASITIKYLILGKTARRTSGSDEYIDFGCSVHNER